MIFPDHLDYFNSGDDHVFQKSERFYTLSAINDCQTRDSVAATGFRRWLLSGSAVGAHRLCGDRDELGVGYPFAYDCRTQVFAWLYNFRRLVVRYAYHAANFLSMVQLGCAVILLRQF